MSSFEKCYKKRQENKNADTIQAQCEFYTYNMKIENEKSTKIDQSFLDELIDLKFSDITIRKKVFAIFA